MTQACDLNCAHCRANAKPKRHPRELSTAEAFHLIDQIAEMRVPLFVLTGGDPLKRPDLMPIVQYACRRGVRTSLTPEHNSAARAGFHIQTEGERPYAAGVELGWINA
jgi:AdoMet-dependent heme synthase